MAAFNHDKKTPSKKHPGKKAGASLVKPLSEQPLPTNAAGLPEALKNGLEQLSGFALTDVRVHRNSDKPASLVAHPDTQGTGTPVAQGQEQQLPREAWQVVQQAPGRVGATSPTNDGAAVNEQTGLETEADKMGAQAME